MNDGIAASRLQGRERALGRREEAVEVVRLRLPGELEPGCADGGARLRTDRDRRNAGAGGGEGPRRRRGGEEDEVADGRGRRPELDGAVEGEERRRRARRRAAGGRPRQRRGGRVPPAAAARRAVPPASRRPGRGRARARAPRSSAAVPGPIAASRRGGPVSRCASSAAPFGLVTTTQSYGAGSTGSAAERLDADQRTEHDLDAERRQALGELRRLLLRAGDDDADPAPVPSGRVRERPCPGRLRPKQPRPGRTRPPSRPSLTPALPRGDRVGLCRR